MNIFVPVNASPVERNAAQELSTNMQKVYNEEFPIVAECGCQAGIYVGFTDFAAQRDIRAQGGINELNGAEAWLIRAVDGSVVVTGGNCNTDRGIVYAAEHFLEDVVGIRFWNSLEEYFPSLSNFSIDPTLELSGEPEMVIRNANSGTYVGNDMLLAIRQRRNDLPISKDWGGGVTYANPGHAHTVDRILPRAGLFEQHPDWFAWNDGLQKRLSYGQYCLNNPELIKAFEEAFMQNIEKCYAECDANNVNRPYHFHISLDDSIYQCECPLCKESFARSGCTGNFLRFANRTARAAREKYPNVRVEVLAYEHYIEPPLDDTLPETNMPVRLADVHVDIQHSIEHPSNARTLRLLKTWSDICKKVGVPYYIWDYNAVYVGVFASNIRRMADNYRIYSQHGIQGNYTEHEEDLLADFWALRHWLLVHFLENPYSDTEALIADFMPKYYGAAAPFLRQWMDLKEDATEASPLSLGCVRNFNKVDHIPYELYIEGNRLFDLAEKSVRGDATLTLRVRQARACLDVSICTRYDLLTYMAAQRGETFPIPRETAGLRISLTVSQTKQQLLAQMPQGRSLYAGLWEGVHPVALWQTPYKPVELPEQFANTGALQINMGDYVLLGTVGCSLEHVRDDDSLSGYASYINIEKAATSIGDLMRVLPKDAPIQHHTFAALHRGKLIEEDFFLEDITPDQYAMYHVIDIDDLSEDSDTMLRICHEVFRLSISGLAKIFPGKKLSFWVRAKYSGPRYGGSADVPSSVAFDRLYVVPKD